MFQVRLYAKTSDVKPVMMSVRRTLDEARQWVDARRDKHFSPWAEVSGGFFTENEFIGYEVLPMKMHDTRRPHRVLRGL